MDFAKDNENLKILGGAMGEKELTVDEIKTLASLPSLEVIRAKLLSLLVSTQTNIACTLNATQSGLARLINTKYQEKGDYKLPEDMAKAACKIFKTDPSKCHGNHYIDYDLNNLIR